MLNTRLSKVLLALIILFIGAFLYSFLQVPQEGDGRLHITFIDVGEGDSIFVKFPHGGKMLVDGGTYEAGQNAVLPYLLKIKGLNLDSVVVTHPHSDHMGGIVALLGRANIGFLIDNGQSVDTKLYRSYIRKRTGIPHRVVWAGYKITGFDGVEVLVLNPPEGLPFDKINNNSIVIKLVYMDVGVLLTSDIEKEAERFLTGYGALLQSFIMKAAHHGSSTSNTEEFLKLVNPKVVVITCGKGNMYGHPHKEAMERFRRLGADVFRTDEEGSIYVDIGEDRIEITTDLGRMTKYNMGRMVDREPAL